MDRTQPGLPLKKGRAGTMTHDYKRHGTTAAFDILEGKVTGRCMQRHRASGVHPVPERRRARGPAGKSVSVLPDRAQNQRSQEN
jgi:hypothetical protein